MAMADILGGSETLLVEDTVDGTIDHKGYPAKRSSSGGWRSAYFIIGAEVLERFSYYGIGTNLINYLTGPLGQSTAVAAANVNSWFGTSTIVTLLGAFVADSYLGRYRTIVIASLLYILGLGLLTLSAVLPFQSTFDCRNTHQSTSCSPPQLRIIFFFISLYLVAVAQGGYKPCTQALGADQFDGQNREENKAKSSFFNWWLFCLSACTSVSYVILSYIQDNLSWGLGFGIPCTVMIASLLIFLLGTKTYRYILKGDEKSPLLRIGKVFFEAARNWRTSPSLKATEEQTQGTLPRQGSHQFKFLNKALPMQDYLKEGGDACTVKDVEEAKAVLRLFPIWSTCLVYGIVQAQSSTLFTKQGNTMDRSIGSGFDIPAASLQSIVPITIVLSIPIYDCIFVPIARALTRKPSGITMLQRIGTGGFLYAISMVIAAIVEIKRLKTAQEHGLLDMPNVAVPMKVWWLVPQYAMFGVADVFAVGGLQEFFYDQVPSELRSVGLSLYLSLFGVGSFLSGFLISAIEKATGGDGRSSWFNSNLNRAHLDYFYWLLAMLTAGLGLLTLSAMLPSLIPSFCQNIDNPPQFQVVLFFFSLYLVTVGQSGHKPCTQAFGADQFDGQHPEECKAKSSFFNWWYFALCSGISVAFLILSYIQENLNWVLGFGIPCIVMVAALLLFLLGTKTYRYSINTNEENPFVRIGKVFVAATRNWRTMPSLKTAEEVAGETLPHHGSHQFNRDRFLSKALLTLDCSKEDGKACSFSDVEEAKAVLKLFPIWITSLVFGILPAQLSTFFTKQGITMDRSTGLGFDIPAASLQSLNTTTIVIFIPIYDRILVPIARHLTRKPSGISMLQRIGTGMFLYIISMVIAALIEVKRLKKAEEQGLVDTPNVTIPMSVWWLVPQYVLSGVGDALTMVGFQEFFYDQAPNELRSVGIALYLSIFGLGSFLSSFLISAIDKVTGGDGHDSWFNDNLNKAHLDYFYWLLVGLGLLGLAGYVYFAKSYIYNKRGIA